MTVEASYSAHLSTHARNTARAVGRASRARGSSRDCHGGPEARGATACSAPLLIPIFPSVPGTPLRALQVRHTVRGPLWPARDPRNAPPRLPPPPRSSQLHHRFPPRRPCRRLPRLHRRCCCPPLRPPEGGAQARAPSCAWRRGRRGERGGRARPPCRPPQAGWRGRQAGCAGRPLSPRPWRR